MKTIEQWLDEYERCHQNRINKILHCICVPLIMLSVLGLLWPISISIDSVYMPFGLNWAVIIILFALLYYAFISLSLAAGMLMVSAGMILVLDSLANLQMPLWQISLQIFVVAWTGQFIGHRFEGKSPAFFKDVQFLLIGPLWLLSFVYRKLNISY